MGYTTQADERLQKAKYAVSTGIKELGEVVIGECSGVSEYKDDYLEKTEKAFDLLREVRKLLA